MAVNAYPHVNLGIQKAFAIGLHADALLGASLRTCTTATTVLFVGYVYHALSFTIIILNLPIKKSRSDGVKPTANETNATDMTDIIDTMKNFR